MQDMHSEMASAESHKSGEKKVSVPRYVTLLLVIALLMGVVNFVFLLDISRRTTSKDEVLAEVRLMLPDTTWKTIPLAKSELSQNENR